MIRRFFLILLVPVLPRAVAQEITEIQNDSVTLLNEVIVQAYAANRPLSEVPAAVSFLDQKDFQRFSNTSFLPAINSAPGVRMEERSPGSYRLSIRGSTLRSPFGIRNVKVYWNDLPFTDPGGNTYLNLLDFSMVQNAEVIKGPGSSLYGAGTGGVLLLESPTAASGEDNLELSTVTGSFGLFRYNLKANTTSEKVSTSIQYSHQRSDGYREQTQMFRDVVQAQGSFLVDEHRSITGSIFYADLFYQTPGGLTKTQFEEDPEQARPPAGPNPGAVEQHAAVNNKTFFAGITHDYQVSTKWSNMLSVYASLSQFKNPAIRNYERRAEQSFGGRSVSKYQNKNLTVSLGGEFQFGFSPIRVYDNNQGTIGSLQTDDEITSTTYFVFTQAEWEFLPDVFLSAGGSLNMFNIHFERFSDVSPVDQKREFDPEFSPRLALLKKLNEKTSVYANISKGFSTPTVAELYPSSGIFDKKLIAEKGISYEIGTRGKLLKNTLQYDLVGYSFQLKETIVVRRTPDDADYFVNAGNTAQKGVELKLSWIPVLQDGLISDFRVSASGTFNHYRFREYVQVTDDFSGNKLTGVPPRIIFTALDVTTRHGIYSNITYVYTDEIPLNDANTSFSDAYSFLSARIGVRFTASKKLRFDLFGGVDNALDERYSLGHDLNAFGDRFYNTAPARNFYGGFHVQYVMNNPKP